MLISCSKENGAETNPLPGPGPDPDQKLEFIISDAVTLNPSGYAPLSAMISLELRQEAGVSLRVVGKDGVLSDVVQDFPGTANSWAIPVHGLYGNYENTVELSFYGTGGELSGIQKYTIRTEPLQNALPLIYIEEAKRSLMASGMTLVSYFGHAGSLFPQRPFIFDAFGHIRWYLDFKDHPDLKTLFYDDGMERLANGNFYFGSGGNDAGATADNRIYEIDLFGNVLNTWEMPGYAFHHEVFEKPNGNFLVTVNKLGAATIEDHIIEIDRNTGNIVKVWDLNQSMQNTRTTWTTDTVDWFHANAVLYDPSDDTIIVSGRTQGIIKLTSDNQVVWILAPHRGWGASGTGEDLNTYLLQPLDNQGQPIGDASVLEGDVNHGLFEWPWYPHAPELMPDGDLLVFDNGDNRNYGSGNLYSRAVQYRIDAARGSIQQVWQYGKERAGNTYSRIVSDVDYLKTAEHILFSPGAILMSGAAIGKSIEVDVASGELIFEATIIPPVAFFGIITFHRTERLSLYP